MRRREGEVLQAIRAAHEFIGRHAPKFPTVAETGSYRQLGEAIRRMEDHAAQQSAHQLMGQGATKVKRAAREALLNDHMRPIAAVSRMVADERPGALRLRMPRAYLAPELLIARAEGFASEARAHEADYVDAGLPTDFLARMDDAISALRKVSGGAVPHRAARAGATVGVQAELSHARKLLKVMDSFVTMAVDDKPALLAEWQNVKRLPRPKSARVEIASPASPRLLTAGAVNTTARLAVGEPQPAGVLDAMRRLFRRGSSASE